MDDSSQSFRWWRRYVDYLLHPVFLFFLLAVTVASVWYAQKQMSLVLQEIQREGSAHQYEPSAYLKDVAIGKYRLWQSSLVGAFLGFLVMVLLTRYYYATRQMRRALDDVERERDRVWSPQIETERVKLRKAVESSPASISVGIAPEAQLEADTGLDKTGSTIYLRGIELENIRCFERLGLAFEDEQGPYFTTILLGDNAAGKSTILRSIALGLCPESDAVSLMKGLQGSFLRKGASRGSVLLHLRSTDRAFSGWIRTSIEQTPSGEVIRQTTEPVNFPWDRIFVCGYGTHRSSGRPSSHQSYVAREAVGTLFSDLADLLNPEVVLLRRDPATRQRLELILKQILLLEDKDGGIRATDNGIELGGPWGSQPLSAVSDGYRSTSQWVLDYLGWQVFANRLEETSLDGILLIDELEQHLHPRWQRYFVQRLRAQFDRTQIIASSHTPLLAAGLADVSRSQLVRLIPTAEGLVQTLKIPIGELTGKRADQILADAFGLITSKSPGSIAKIDRYTELLGRTRSASEQQELETLRKELEDTWSAGDSKLTRVADKAVSKVLDSMIDELGDPATVSAHIKQRLSDLFSDKEAEQ